MPVINEMDALKPIRCDYTCWRVLSEAGSLQHPKTLVAFHLAMRSKEVSISPHTNRDMAFS